MKSSYPFALDKEGYFTKSGKRFFPVGVNYWPTSCGVEVWKNWTAEATSEHTPKEKQEIEKKKRDVEAEIKRDLDLMVKLNFNCLRFFVRWEDFEPQEGVYDEKCFEKFDQFLALCKERGLTTQPAVITGWMSGGIFWPEWKKGRNLYSDPVMRKHSYMLASKISKICSKYPETVLLIDQGNEVCCLPDCETALPSQIESWCKEFNEAIKHDFPEVMIISGVEQNQFVRDSGWRFEKQPGCDLYSMHGYPNGTWHSLMFDGMTDPLGHTLLPFYTKLARSFGPVMLQEFGTIFTASKCCTEYLAPMLDNAWKAGANGFLWWSIGDFKAPGVHPYNKNPFEEDLGITDANGKIKPPLQPVKDLFESLPTRKIPVVDQGDVAIYWPLHFYWRENEEHNPGNKPWTLSQQMGISQFILGGLGYRVGIVHHDKLENASAHTIVLPGVSITGREAEALIAWVKKGGHLIINGIDLHTVGIELSNLMGARGGDLRVPLAKDVQVFGKTWEFNYFGERGLSTQLTPFKNTEVVAVDSKGIPMVLCNKLGKGTVVTCTPTVDQIFARETGIPGVRDTQWKAWYKGMLKLADSPAPKNPEKSLEVPIPKSYVKETCEPIYARPEKVSLK